MITISSLFQRILRRSDFPHSGSNPHHIESNSSDGPAEKPENINSVPANRQSLSPEDLGYEIFKIILNANNKGDILENIEGFLNYCKTGGDFCKWPVEKIINLLDKHGTNPSQIIKNIEDFFSDLNDNTSQKLIEFFRCIRDNSDEAVNESDFSAIPELKKLFADAVSKDHGKILDALITYIKLTGLSLKAVDANNRDFLIKHIPYKDEILQELRELFNNNFFDLYPSYSQDNLLKISTILRQTPTSPIPESNQSSGSVKLKDLFENLPSDLAREEMWKKLETLRINWSSIIINLKSDDQKLLNKSRLDFREPDGKLRLIELKNELFKKINSNKTRTDFYEFLNSQVCEEEISQFLKQRGFFKTGNDENRLVILVKDIIKKFYDKETITPSEEDLQVLQPLNYFFEDNKFIFDAISFFSQSPKFDKDFIQKISPKLNNQFGYLSDESKKTLFNLLHDLVQNHLPKLTKTESYLVSPIKDKLKDFNFLRKLDNQFYRGQTSPRFLIDRSKQIAISPELRKQLVKYQSEKRNNIGILANTIESLRSNPNIPVKYFQFINDFSKQIEEYFLENEVYKPTLNDLKNYYESLQKFTRRKFLQYGTGAAAVSLSGIYGMATYNEHQQNVQEKQYQEYLDKKFKISDQSIDDPQFRLRDRTIFLDDLNHFLNSFKEANSEFNKKSKEALFGSGVLDIPDSIDLEPGAIIVSDNFLTIKPNLEFYKSKDQSVARMTNKFEFKEALLDEQLTRAGVNKNDLSRIREDAKKFFTSSFDGNLANLLNCPFFPFFNSDGKLRILIESQSANYCYSPIRTLDDLETKDPENFKNFIDLFETCFEKKFNEVYLANRSEKYNDSNSSKASVPQFMEFFDRYNEIAKNSNNSSDLAKNPEYIKLIEDVNNHLDQAYSTRLNQIDNSATQTLIRQNVDLMIRNFHMINLKSYDKLVSVLGYAPSNSSDGPSNHVADYMRHYQPLDEQSSVSKISQLTELLNQIKNRLKNSLDNVF
jgi:hypothetical protein